MTATPNDTWLGFKRWTRALIKSTGLSDRRHPYILRTRATDRIVQQLKDDALANLQVPELALEVGFVKKDVASRRADDTAALPTGQELDPAFALLAGIYRLRRADVRRRSIGPHRTPLSESGLPTRKAAHC